MEDHDRLIRLETQIERLVSDAESEKDTRARENARINQEIGGIRESLNATNKLAYIGMGIMLALQFLVPLMLLKLAR